MRSPSKLDHLMENSLRCPKCKSKLESKKEEYICINSKCAFKFPIIDGIPILIDEENSIYSIGNLVSKKAVTNNNKNSWKIKSILSKALPTIGENIKASKNYIYFNKLLDRKSKVSHVLVIGGGFAGKGMEVIISSENIELVETDVSFGPRTMLICDAHDIPFADDCFDGVIIQAVLEHVVDPYKCVEEIYRVLNRDGLVYAETPFMQQVHMGRYDFTRFTHLGHRRLFRKFKELDSGAVCGPGMALAWSYQYFLLSFTKRKVLRQIIIYFSGFTSFFLKYFDNFLIDKAGTYDSASGYYFIGKKSNITLTDRQLIKLYKGAL